MKKTPFPYPTYLSLSLRPYSSTTTTTTTMHLPSLPWIALLSAASMATARPPAAASSSTAAAKPPAFFLAGDSTTAVDGGWGNGFLAPLISPAWGVNVGKSGATTVSFVAGGYWENVTTHLKENAEEFECYVTISFGHNDQKEASGITLEQYQANLVRFANEVKSLGGTPVSFPLSLISYSIPTYIPTPLILYSP